VTLPGSLTTALAVAPLIALSAFHTTASVALRASPRAQGDWGVAYAPEDRATRQPAIVFLHGMWASPEDSCEPFESAATPFGFLVCPRANAPMGDAGPGYMMWSGGYADAARSIHAALDAADALAPGKRAAQGGTLIGFSNGAYFAAEVACSEPGRWSGLVLLSMKLDLDRARLAGAGVTRVLLAAGERDEARTSMQDLAARLNEHRPGERDGGGALEARYMSLGDVGHAFPSDMGTRMCAAIAWVRGSTCTLSL
jgi:predicted esterase